MTKNSSNWLIELIGSAAKEMLQMQVSSALLEFLLLYFSLHPKIADRLRQCCRKKSGVHLCVDRFCVPVFFPPSKFPVCLVSVRNQFHKITAQNQLMKPIAF